MDLTEERYIDYCMEVLAKNTMLEVFECNIKYSDLLDYMRDNNLFELWAIDLGKERKEYCLKLLNKMLENNKKKKNNEPTIYY